MIEYPRVFSLLQQLAGLSDEDMRLPWELLVNVQRATLRRPLENLARLGSRAGEEDAADYAEQVANEAWPELAGGDLLPDSVRVAEIYLTLQNLLRDPVFVQRREQILEGKPVVLELMVAAGAEWTAHDPLVWLHELSWGTDIMEQVMPMLEAELEVHPAVEEMILTLGAL